MLSTHSASWRSFGLRWIEQRWAGGGCSIDVTDDRIAQPHRRPEAKKMDSPLHPVSRYVWAKLFFSVGELPTRIFSLLWASDQPVCPPFFSLAIYDTKGQRRLLRVDSRGMKVSMSGWLSRRNWCWVLCKLWPVPGGGEQEVDGQADSTQSTVKLNPQSPRWTKR
jgi:hypothetical protein